MMAPLIGAIGLAVRAALGSPVLFRQRRPGLSGQEFELIKFRTMVEGATPSGAQRPDCERITSLGRFLRASSLDELPELWNVLKGDMSLVGPRPLLTRYTPYFTETERRRFSVRPGITGLAQVEGRNDLHWDLRLAKDVEYVERCGISLDLKILALTLLRVLRRDGLRVDPGASMLDFDEERRRAGVRPGDRA